MSLEFSGVKEKTLLLVKPDGVQRGLVGEIIRRLELKGLKIVGLKMMHLDVDKIKKHYEHLVEKPFYPKIEKFMNSNPVVAICAEGLKSVDAVRLIAGITYAGEADGGTIRGDLAMGMCNVVHCTDSVENAKAEVERFFSEDEIFDYNKTDYLHVYAEDEREK